MCWAGMHCFHMIGSNALPDSTILHGCCLTCSLTLLFKIKHCFCESSFYLSTIFGCVKNECDWKAFEQSFLWRWAKRFLNCSDVTRAFRWSITVPWVVQKIKWRTDISSRRSSFVMPFNIDRRWSCCLCHECVRSRTVSLLTNQLSVWWQRNAVFHLTRV